MKLNLRERFQMPEILPKEGNFTKLVIKNDILDKIKITQEDIKEYEIASEGTSVKWNASKDLEKELEVEFTELELNLIKEALAKLDAENKLTDETFPIYKKFIN